MKDLSKQIAVIFYGPPGSGKGTQADLLADKLGFFHLDTGDTLRKIIYDPKFKKNKVIQREKKLNEAGLLQTPTFVLDVISKKIKELFALKQSIVMSGSPRTIFEAFGNRKTTGEIQILEKLFGRKNIFIFILEIREGESRKRNSLRKTCSVCKNSFLGSVLALGGCDIRFCPLCGGKIIRRIDDDPKIIKTRLREYRERTKPIFDKLREKKFVLFRINGAPAPYKIHEKIVSILIK